MAFNKLNKNRDLNGVNSPLSYMGINAIGSYAASQTVTLNRVPTANDYKNFIIGCIWIVPSTSANPVVPNSQLFYLAALIGNQATWVELADTASVAALTLTGNSGGAITPTAGNWNILTAGSTPEFVGAGSTLTLDFALNNLLIGSNGLNITTADFNACFGKNAGISLVDGEDNTLIGYSAGSSLDNSSRNTAIGSFALIFATSTCEYNIAIGYNSAINYAATESSNICIGSPGVLGESNTLRIGNFTGAAVNQTNKTYICGIDGRNVGSVAEVVTMGTGGTADQLGSAVITAGSGITVTPTANTITIAENPVNTSKPAFLGYLDSIDADVTGTGTIYVLGTNTALTERFDQGGNFTTNGIFTAPVTGKYQLSANAFVGDCTISTQLNLVITTSNQQYETTEFKPAASAIFMTRALSYLCDMDAGDTAFVRISSFGEAADTNDLIGGIGINNAVGCGFSGYLAC